MLTAAFEIQALSLPLSDRAELASKLIASLDDMQEAETESLWLDVAQDRATQLDGNPSLGISFEHSDAKLRAILTRQP
jgi:Putative addiction module component